MELSPGGQALALVLTQVRSAVRVGLALSEAYPEEANWEAFLTTPLAVETLNELALLIQDIHERADDRGGTYQAMIDSYTQDHLRAVECLEPFCEHLAVPPEDVLSTIANA